MSKEDLLISSGTLFEIYCGDHEKYETIKIETLGSHSWRHGYGGIVIFKDPETDKFYQSSWRNSSNEMNGWSDMNYGDQKCYEVKPVKEVVTKYKKAKNNPEDKVHNIQLTSIKDPDRFNEVCHALGVDKELRDKYFEFGEYADLSLWVDDELNIVKATFLEQ